MNTNEICFLNDLFYCRFREKFLKLVKMYFSLSIIQSYKNMWSKSFWRVIMRKKFKSPVELLMYDMFKRFKQLKKSRKLSECQYSVTKMLDMIIRDDYFGSTRNRKRFYHLVNKITTQSFSECIYRHSLHRGYDIKVMKWLQQQNLDNKTARKLLQKMNRYLITYIVKPLIKHFYQPVRLKWYQITFFRRNVWHSFESRVSNELLTEEYLKLCDDQNLKRGRGALKIMPKSSCKNLAYRILVCGNRKSKTDKFYFKKISRKIYELSRKLSSLNKGSSKYLYSEWKEYTEGITKESTLYGIKMDIEDAFGNVDIDMLCQIINESSMPPQDKCFILHHIKNQYVTYKKKLYKWEHGLLQGDNLSSSLCNLYIAHLESPLILKYKDKGNFIYRVEDDYLFCSVKLDQVIQFENDIKKIFQFNESKTQKFFSNDHNYEIQYCGQVFNLMSREVGSYFGFDKKIPLRYKFKLWNIKKPIASKNLNNFILMSLEFKRNNFYFKPIELNTSVNTEEKVLYNYFESMIFIAYKFDVVVKSLTDYRKTAENIPKLTVTIKKIISEYVKCCDKKIRRYKGKNYSGKINNKLLFQIGLKAFILVLKRCNEFYKNVIQEMKPKMLYINCRDFNHVNPYFFTKIPYTLRNVNMNRKTKI